MNSPLKIKERTSTEIRQSIFNFQQTRLEEDNQKINAELAQAQLQRLDSFRSIADVTNTPSPQRRSDDASDKKRVKTSYNTPDKEAKKGFVVGLGLFYFTTPRPLRPSLRAFF
jgi:hypothetical protein